MTGRANRRVLLAAAVAAMAVLPLHAEDRCVLRRVGKLQMTVLGSGHVSVPMNVGGKSLNMLVDTGGFISMLTPPAIAALGLSPQVIPLSRIKQYGGLAVTRFVTAHDIVLAGMHASQFDFLVMPEHGYASDVDGLLAPDILRKFDADFDFGATTLNLFSQDHCEGHVAYWTHDAVGEVDFRMKDGHIVVPVVLDGKEITAMIDTGSPRTIASLETIEDNFGINESSPGLTLRAGGNRDRRAYRYRFKSLSFEDVTVNYPDLVLVPDAQSRLELSGPKILLGMNILRKLHLYIAYGEQKIYVTPATAH